MADAEPVRPLLDRERAVVVAPDGVEEDVARDLQRASQRDRPVSRAARVAERYAADDDRSAVVDDAVSPDLSALQRGDRADQLERGPGGVLPGRCAVEQGRADCVA